MWFRLSPVTNASSSRGGNHRCPPLYFHPVQGSESCISFPATPSLHVPPLNSRLGSDRLVPVLDGSSRDLLPGELSFVCFPDWVYLVPLIPSGKLPPELKFKGFICSEMPLAAFHLTHHYSFSRPRVCFKIFLPLPPNPGESSFVKSIARCQTIHPS